MQEWKDYTSWHKEKIRIERKDKRLYFSEREIWFVHLGSNIGREQEGRGVYFLRPVIILKKFNHESFLAVPLSRTERVNKFSYRFSYDGGVTTSVALLSQVRLIDAKRLCYKSGTINEALFRQLKEKIKQMIA